MGPIYLIGRPHPFLYPYFEGIFTTFSLLSIDPIRILIPLRNSKNLPYLLLLNLLIVLMFL